MPSSPDLAHRLRTPLAVIVGYVEILAMRDTAGENAEVLEHLREASAELDRGDRRRGRGGCP